MSRNEMIAIHTRSGPFAAEWIARCTALGIPFKPVDCFATDIVEQVRDCSALLWHWPHHDFSAQLLARQLLRSVEEMGLAVFPNTASCWHYDDKVGQKYLLEAIGAPLVPAYVFYDRETALQWVDGATFPKVWKLRGGAASQNVRLVASREVARKLILRSFGRGWRNERLHPLRERLWQFRRDRTFGAFINLGRGLARAVIPHPTDRRGAVQRDYAYFQDFAPGNDCDIRVIVIGHRAFAIKRRVRQGDFRASGSGTILYDPAEIPAECVRIAHDVAARLRTQSCAFDFVRHGDRWGIVEISYAFTAKSYYECPGYWDSDLNWIAAPVIPEHFMLEDLLRSLPDARTRAQ